MADIKISANYQDLLRMFSINLYADRSRWLVELIQNAYDSCILRQLEEGNFQAQISIVPDVGAGSITIKDNGQGMTEKELMSYFSSAGSSKKRELIEKEKKTGRSELVGQFGLGFLSAFSVSRRIQIITMSTQPGSKQLRVNMNLEEDHYSLEQKSPSGSEAGTTVIAFLKKDYLELVEVEYLRQVVSKYTPILPIPVFVGDELRPVNTIEVPWRKSVPNNDYRHYVHSHLDPHAQAIIPIKVSEPVSIEGVLYVGKLSADKYPEKRGVDLFVGNVLVAKNDVDVLPQWALFLKGIINADSLDLTVSREEVVNNDALYKTRETLQNVILLYFESLADDDARLLRSIITSNSNELKRHAVSNDVLFDSVIDWLEFDTLEGRKTLPEYFERTLGQREIYIVSDTQAFQQLRSIAQHQDLLLIDASSDVDRTLLEKYVRKKSDIDIVRLEDIERRLLYQQTHVGSDWEGLVVEFSQIFGVETRLSAFEPSSIPVLLRERQQTNEVLSRLLEMPDTESNLRDLLAQISSKATSQERVAVINTRSPLMQKLRETSFQDRRIQSILRVVYYNGILSAGLALTTNELDDFQKSCNELGLGILQNHG